jgi:hypothetical protein
MITGSELYDGAGENLSDAIAKCIIPIAFYNFTVG